MDYLSEIHDAKKMNLRFLPKPFSFIFLFTGNTYYHIIWETLDTSEATYLWHVEKTGRPLKQEFMNIEAEINMILVNGKMKYIQSRNENFNRIFHDYSDTDNGFLKWKADISEVLI